MRERFDLATAAATISATASSDTRTVLSEPLYDRLARNAGSQRIEHSIGPDDVLIVEGVPALLMDDLLALPRALKVYVDVEADTRNLRLKQDYAWRGTQAEQQAATLAARELDETPIVEQSRTVADFVVGQDLKAEK